MQSGTEWVDVCLDIVCCCYTGGVGRVQQGYGQCGVYNIVRMNTDTELRKQFNICTMYKHDTENPIYIKAREQILNIRENI